MLCPHLECGWYGLSALYLDFKTVVLSNLEHFIFCKLI
jgi:hypothetical protein